MNNNYKEWFIMKFLRGLYMIIATIALLPLIIAFEIAYLIYVVYTCIKIDETREALRIWYRCLVTGIKMNLDFIEN